MIHTQEGSTASVGGAAGTCSTHLARMNSPMSEEAVFIADRERKYVTPSAPSAPPPSPPPRRHQRRLLRARRRNDVEALPGEEEEEEVVAPVDKEEAHELHHQRQLHNDDVEEEEEEERKKIDDNAAELNHNDELSLPGVAGKGVAGGDGAAAADSQTEDRSPEKEKEFFHQKQKEKTKRKLEIDGQPDAAEKKKARLQNDVEIVVDKCSSEGEKEAAAAVLHNTEEGHREHAGNHAADDTGIIYTGVNLPSSIAATGGVTENDGGGDGRWRKSFLGGLLKRMWT